jgi:DNA-binding NtrC family response regulator
MQYLRHRCECFADSSYPILLLGDRGTGKTSLARLIHQMSPWHDGPFLVEPIPHVEPLMDSRLRGHTADAYTGAKSSVPSIFEAAEGGTLFLDEVAFASQELQQRLLTMVEDGEFSRLGALRKIRVRTRLLFATNEPLEVHVASGRFRTDLHDRIRTLRLYLPPLRERPDEIPGFARLFLDESARKLRIAAPALSSDALELLQQQPWPGNLRDLKAVLVRTLHLVRGATTIEAEDLDFDDTDGAGRPIRKKLTPEIFDRALELSGGNRVKAAGRLGYSPRHTQRISAQKPPDPI